jgi:hypothetical protein
MADTAATPAPDAALTPGVSDTLAPPAALTVEQAQAKKAELFGKAGFAQRVLAGDPESVRLWKEVTAALSPKVEQTTQEAQDYAARMASLSILKAKADLSDEVWDHAAAGGFVSPAEKEKAIFAKERLFKDKAWVKRYFDGDREANSTMTNINLILASKIGTFEQIEEFKKAAAKRLGK